MLKDNYPKVSNTREGNALLFDIYEKEYESQEKQLQVISKYYSSDMTLEKYNNANQKIKNDYSKEVKTILNEYTGGLDNFNKLMMDNIGKTGEGVSVSGQVINVSPEKTDEFIGLNENGMPTFKKKNGTQYTIADSE